MIKHILLSLNPQKDPNLSVTRRAMDILSSYGMQTYAPDIYADVLGDKVSYFKEGVLPSVDLILVFGGDGSVLRAAQDAVRLDAPILGVNLGRLGFLNELEVDRLEDLGRLATGEYEEKNKMMLSVTVHRDGRDEVLPMQCLNDVVISGMGHLSDMRLMEGEHTAIDYRADGIVVSTPSGSTAYSLSAGGAIVDDRLEVLLVTPICPRSFFARSVIFMPNEVLRVQNCSERNVSLSLVCDGVDFGAIRPGESVSIQKAPRNLKMIGIQQYSTMRVLQRKMKMQNF